MVLDTRLPDGSTQPRRRKKKAHSFPHEKFPDGPCVAECRLLSVDVHKHRRAGRFFLTIFTHFWPRIDSQKRFFSGTAKIAFFLFFGRLRTFAPFARARWWRWRSKSKRWSPTGGGNGIGKKRLKLGEVLQKRTGHFQNTKLMQNLSKQTFISLLIDLKAKFYVVQITTFSPLRCSRFFAVATLAGLSDGFLTCSRQRDWKVCGLHKNLSHRQLIMENSVFHTSKSFLLKFIIVHFVKFQNHMISVPSKKHLCISNYVCHMHKCLQSTQRSVHLATPGLGLWWRARQSERESEREWQIGKCPLWQTAHRAALGRALLRANCRMVVAIWRIVAEMDTDLRSKTRRENAVLKALTFYFIF